MAKSVCIQCKGIEKTVMIKGDKVEDKAGDASGNHITVKDGNTAVGEFNKADIAGWWIQDQ